MKCEECGSKMRFENENKFYRCINKDCGKILLKVESREAKSVEWLLKNVFLATNVDEDFHAQVC